MSLKPSAKNCSASFNVDTVTPTAPAACCRRATSMHFAVLTCGRRRTPSVLACACMRAMLDIMRASSISAAGVGRSFRFTPSPLVEGLATHAQRGDVTLQSERNLLGDRAGRQIFRFWQADTDRLQLTLHARVGNGR